MFTKKFYPLLIALAISILPLKASATEFYQFSFDVGAGAYFYEMDEELEAGQLYELRASYFFNPRVALELSVGGMPSLKRNNSAANGFRLADDKAFGMKYGLEAQYHLGNIAEDKWAPFVAIGAGAIWYDEKMETGGDTDPFGSLGISVRRAISDRWSARADYRLLVVGHDTEYNHSVLFGLGYHFGKRGHDASGTGMGSEDTGVLDKGLISRPELVTVYFPFDSSRLTKEAQATLRNNAQWLNNNPRVRVLLEGHCDERGTNEYNLALGQRRADSVARYLKELGVNASRIETISYGEERPAVSASNEAAWAKNRRTETKEIR